MSIGCSEGTAMFEEFMDEWGCLLLSMICGHATMVLLGYQTVGVACVVFVLTALTLFALSPLIKGLKRMLFGDED